MAQTSPLTPTSYALLGLLAVEPRTTYQLAKQMDRAMHRFWPRTRSKLYEEPKKLVAHGLASATPEAHGKRPRIVYAITPAGRKALAAWLGSPSDGPVFESEHVLKVFLAENGSSEDLRETLAGLRQWAGERVQESANHQDELESGTSGRLPERVLTDRLLHDYLEMLDRWASWAEEQVADWPAVPTP